MEIKKIVTGALDENCYVLKQNNTCLVIDPGDDYPKIKEEIGDCKVLAVLITHSHFDHIGALRNFLSKRNMKIFKRSSLEEKEYTVGDFSFECIYTPGHSKDSITFYFKDISTMFVGDFIFRESIGRCDLPGGDINEMRDSLSKIVSYPDDTIIYSGHGDDTTLGFEKNNNPYFS